MKEQRERRRNAESHRQRGTRRLRRKPKTATLRGVGNERAAREKEEGRESPSKGKDERDKAGKRSKR